MTVKEFYSNISGNYDEALGRLMNDALIRRFALKFLKDPSYEELKEKLASAETEEAFRAAHTLKGVCKNLAFTKLGDSASELTEILRGGDLTKAEEYFPVVQADYECTVAELSRLEG